MNTSCSVELSILEFIPIVLVGVVKLLVGLVGITGWKGGWDRSRKREKEKTLHKLPVCSFSHLISLQQNGRIVPKLA